MHSENPAAENPEPTASAIDFEAALAMVGGDMELLREVAAGFVDEVPRLLNLLHSAIEQHDPETLRNAAHQLQGVMRCLHIESSFQQARQLEFFGEGVSDWQAAAAQLALLNSTVTSAVQTLTGYLNKQQ